MLTPLKFALDLSTCLVALVVLLIVYLWTRRPDPRLPPCPTRPLPVLGNILSLKRNSAIQFMEWRKKYGDVFRIYIGNTLVVIVNGYDAIRELLVKRGDVTSDRPVVVFEEIAGTVNTGLVLSSGNNWKEQRSTVISILRSFGMGKDRLAEKIQEEVDCYIMRLSELRSKEGDQMDIRENTYVAVSNIICSIIIGQRFDYDDLIFKSLIEKLTSNTALFKRASLLHIFPSLRFLPGDLFNAKKIESNITAIKELFAKKYMKQKGSDEYDENNLDSLIAAYIFERDQRTTAGHPTSLDEKNLMKNIMDLFTAGTETTSMTIMWCILYILHHPEVQEKVYQEIVREVGTERRPNMGDKTRLIYLNAVIRETQRLASIAPLALPHLCKADIDYKGYVIPKGTQLLPNLSSVLYDKTVWGDDADKFRPERFIDSTGNLLNPPEFIPFSMGKRVCLGEALAKMELYLFLSAMFQRFKFLPVDATSPPSLNPVIGVSAFPEPYEIKLIDRLAD